MEVYVFFLKIGLDVDIQVVNLLLDMYVKCCYVNYMEYVFRNMFNRDYIFWIIVIVGYI